MSNGQRSVIKKESLYVQIYIINKQKTIRDSHIWHSSKNPLFDIEAISFWYN